MILKNRFIFFVSIAGSIILLPIMCCYGIVNTSCSPQCVTYVMKELPNSSKWKNIKIGEAWKWWDLEADINLKGRLPIVKSIAVFDKWGNSKSINPYGHVGVVIKVIGDSVLIKHANWDSKCSITENWFKISGDKKRLNSYPLRGFIYAWNSQKPNVLSPTAYGAVSFGEKLLVIEKKIGQKAVRENRDNSEPCVYVSFKKYPIVWFRVEYGTVTGMFLDGNDNNYVNTEYGKIYLGMSIADLKKMIKNIKYKNHCNESGGRYENRYYITDGSGQYYLQIIEGKLYESDKVVGNSGRVESIRAGTYDAVNDDDMCH